MSNLSSLRLALNALRTQDLEKVAIVSTVVNVGKALKAGAAHGGKLLEQQGHKDIAKVVKYAPHMATGYAGHRAYKSPTGQRMRYRVSNALARRRMRRGY